MAGALASRPAAVLSMESFIEGSWPIWHQRTFRMLERLHQAGTQLEELALFATTLSDLVHGEGVRTWTQYHIL